MGSENWTGVSKEGKVIDVGEPMRATKVDALVPSVSRHQDGDKQI
jgi:hypothetical protein